MDYLLKRFLLIFQLMGLLILITTISLKIFNLTVNGLTRIMATTSNTVSNNIFLTLANKSIRFSYKKLISLSL